MNSTRNANLKFMIHRSKTSESHFHRKSSVKKLNSYWQIKNHSSLARSLYHFATAKQHSEVRLIPLYCSGKENDTQRKCFYGIRRRMSNGISRICMKIRAKAMYVKWNNSFSAFHFIIWVLIFSEFMLHVIHLYLSHCHTAIISFIIIQLFFTILYFCCCRRSSSE